jgi:hypothetical protein
MGHGSNRDWFGGDSFGQEERGQAEIGALRYRAQTGLRH